MSEHSFPHLIKRIRDKNPEIRATVFKKLIKEQVPLVNLSLSDIYKLIYDGLGSRESHVRDACIRYLSLNYSLFKEEVTLNMVNCWLTTDCELGWEDGHWKRDNNPSFKVQWNRRKSEGNSLEDNELSENFWNGEESILSRALRDFRATRERAREVDNRRLWRAIAVPSWLLREPLVAEKEEETHDNFTRTWRDHATQDSLINDTITWGEGLPIHRSGHCHRGHFPLRFRDILCDHLLCYHST